MDYLKNIVDLFFKCLGEKKAKCCGAIEMNSLVDEIYLTLRYLSGREEIFQNLLYRYVIKPLFKRMNEYVYRYNTEESIFWITSVCFIDMYVHFRMEVLRISLKNSLTDGIYKYPRCHHFNNTAKNLLTINIRDKNFKQWDFNYEYEYEYEDEDEEGEYGKKYKFPICDECRDFINLGFEFLEDHFYKHLF